MLRSLRLQRDASRSIRQYSHWSGSHRWNDGLNLKGKANAGSMKSPKQDSKEATESDNKSSQASETPQASTSAVSLDSSEKSEGISAKGSEQASPSAGQKKESQQKAQKKPHLPAVPVLHAHPHLIATDALYAQHRPLLEVRIPKNKRRTAAAPAEQPKSESSNPFLDELMGQSNDPIENLQLGPVDVQNSAAARYLASRTAFTPPSAPQPPPPAPSPKEKDLAFLSPFSKQPAVKSKYPQSPSFLAGQFSSFLKRVNSKMNTEEQQALDAFFQSNEPLEEVVKRHAEGRYNTKVKDEGLAAAIEAAKHFISLLPTMEAEGGKAYRLNKSDEGQWVAEEMDSFSPGEMTLGGEGSAVAYVERLPEGSPIEEEGVEIIDLTKAPGNGAQLNSILSMLQRSFDKSSQNQRSQDKKSQDDEEFIGEDELAQILSDYGSGREPTGKRFPLGPRNLARRGARTIAGVYINMDSVKRKRKTKMSKHKYKKRRKAQKAIRRRQGK